MSKILLSQENFHLSETNLPCLIHGNEGSGSSFFTVELVKDMFRLGSKLLFFSAYPMAKEQFMENMENGADNIKKIFSADDIDITKQGLLIMQNDKVLFSKIIDHLFDIPERVIVIKNIDQIDESIIEACLQFKKIILSGNIDMCSIKGEILKKEFSTKILFSQSEHVSTPLPTLNNYEGYLESITEKGIVTISS